jgi:hypothetical protein
MDAGIVPFGQEEKIPHWCNTGSPRSRSRTERIQSTILGRDAGFVRCPSVIRVGLSFVSADPLEVVEKLMGAAGITEPEMLRARYPSPAEPCICRAERGSHLLPVETSPRDEVLAQVLILALSTPCLYDPGRPLLITRTSLTRRLELFDARGYYV